MPARPSRCAPIVSLRFQCDMRPQDSEAVEQHNGRQKRTTDRGHSALEILHQSAFEFRSEEHTSELQSRVDLVCRLLLEKKKKKRIKNMKQLKRTNLHR